MTEEVLIDINLKLFKPISYKVLLWDLILSDGKKTGNMSNGIMISRILSDKGLGEVVNHYFFLNEKGKEILKNGGWIYYLERFLNHKNSIEKQNEVTQHPSQKKMYLSGFWANIVTIITFIILVINLIPENTKYIGWLWIKEHYNL